MTRFIECLDNFWLNINKKINKFKSTKLLITLITLIIWKEQKWHNTFTNTKMADHILEIQKWQTTF